MRKRYIFSTLLSASLLFSCNDSEIIVPESNGGDNGNAAVINVPQDVVNGELFVKFKPEVEDILDNAGALSRSGNASRSSIPSVDEVLDIAGAYKFERVFPVDKRNEARTRESGLHLWYLVKFDEKMDVQKVAQDMSKLAEVAAVQYNHEIKRAYSTAKKAKAVEPVVMSRNGVSVPFNDPYLKDQWSYINDGTILNVVAPEVPVTTAVAAMDVNCQEAWEKCTGDPSIIVAVMDEGVMYNHEDLAANMWTNPNETLGGKEDNDGNGYAGDRHGYNFVTDCGLITYSDINDMGHGTHVAGTIAAVNNNGTGVCGIAGGSGQGDGVKIMSLQIFAGNAGSSLLMEAKAIKYAADNGAVILQCSWGYNSGRANMNSYVPGYTSDEQWAKTCILEKEVMEYFMRYAGDPNGTIEGGLIIFAAGNEYAPMAAYPGAYKDFICVASIGPDGTPAPYSNYSTPSGSKNMITAPGGDGEGTKNEKALILSTMPAFALSDSDIEPVGKSGYGYMEGTSMACPHISGVAALGLSYAAQQRKHYRAEDFKEMLLNSVESLDDKLNKTKSYWYGWASFGESAIHMTMDLPNYKGKIGGLIDAKILLDKIDGNEYGAQPMKVPNVYVGVGENYTINLSRIYNDGVTASSYEVVDSNIAAVVLEGNSLKVTGTAVGTTKASVTDNNGNTQEFVITVRKSSGNGWM